MDLFCETLFLALSIIAAIRTAVINSTSKRISGTNSDKLYFHIFLHRRGNKNPNYY